MIIMNNFVLKQPSPLAPAEKQWGFPSPLEVMPQSQVVLLQPVVSNGSSSSPKTGSENIRQSKSYMLPQPALQTSIKSISNSEAADNRSQAAESQEQLSDKSLSPLTGNSSLPLYRDEFRTQMDSNRIHADKYQDPFSIDSNKSKRFSNTYNILNKSGLLGITMRTKQLIKENKRTQGQLQQLQEQTALLLEALSSRDPKLWIKLQLSLQHTDKEQWGAKVQRVLG